MLWGRVSYRDIEILFFRKVQFHAKLLYFPWYPHIFLLNQIECQLSNRKCFRFSNIVPNSVLFRCTTLFATGSEMAKQFVRVGLGLTGMRRLDTFHARPILQKCTHTWFGLTYCHHKTTPIKALVIVVQENFPTLLCERSSTSQSNSTLIFSFDVRTILLRARAVTVFKDET